MLCRAICWVWLCLAALTLVPAAGWGNNLTFLGNIEVTQTEGPWRIDGTDLIGATGGGHLLLDTLQVNESSLQFAPYDIEIKVTAQPGTNPDNFMLAIDKDIFNKTHRNWWDFHIELGTGLGAGFVPSTDIDGLFFKGLGMNTSGHFQNPPMQDGGSEIDSLWWVGPPGLAPDPLMANLPGKFWLDIQVPNGFNAMDGMAVFTLRQIPTPEPSSWALAVIGVATAAGAAWQHRRVGRR